MRTTLAIALGIAVFGIAGSVRAADEVPAKSKIVSVSLFKNGLAIVKREATLGKPGVYVLDDVPQPVHGTYWIESTGSIESVVKMRDVEVAATETVPGNLQEDLAGKKVTIHFKGENRPPVIGTMIKFKKPKTEEGAGGEMRVEMGSRFLVLQTGKGRTYVEASEIAYFEAENPDEKVIRRQPRLLLTLGDTNKEETKVAITYLTRGMAWAPSYKLDITDPKTLSLEQQAVVKNELADLDGAEIKLISGYPSVQFAHVTSPLSLRTNWTNFFQELGNRRWRDNDFTSNSVMAQQGFANNPGIPFNIGLGATPTGEGVDLHYQSIGKRTLAAGESLAMTVARGKTSYERIVEWLVPDTRNEYGQEVGARGRGDEPDDGGDSAWDALKFKNPLPFAMTTGPAMVVADGKFNGQRSTYWVNAGEETVLRVEKALSVRTRALENEEIKNAGDGRDFVWIGGRHFRKSLVEGELAVSNHRNETIQVVLRRRFSGDLIEADGNPKSSLREEGVYSVNKRNELLWTLPLKAGEERKLKYRYSVLVAQ